MYDENHIKPCEVCCTHPDGWWKMEDSYGENNGKYACKKGCGTVVESIPSNIDQSALVLQNSIFKDMAKPAEVPKRVSIPKSVRFEVFKRDHFTCQYCGQKAPDIVLHVDHIDPVSKGGSSEIINLITSCYACNLGKSDKRLTDTSAIDKQRKQLELIQERREQIELMFQWKESLSNLDKETLEMIKDYAHARIEPFTISENGEDTDF